MNNEFFHLREWVNKHMPALGAKLRMVDNPVAMLRILNDETGLNIQGSEGIREGSKKFLEALQNSAQSQQG